MNRAGLSRCPIARAGFALALVLAAAAPARAEETPAMPEFVVIPADCLQFWVSSSDPVPHAWDSLLSFAACIQDGSIDRVDRADQLEDYVDNLQSGLAFPLHLYQIAIQGGPGPVQLRAAYYVALGQVALITRARRSLATPELRPELERILEPHGRLAFFVFDTIDRVAEQDPSLTTDDVNRYMVRSARQLAAALAKNWSFTIEDAPLLALPR